MGDREILGSKLEPGEPTDVGSEDPFGRRIRKVLTTVANGATKTASWDYLYDADNVGVETYVANGITEKTFYIAGKNVDEHLGMVRNGQKYFFHQDGLGSVTTITNGSQGVVQSYTYDSFGLPKPSTGFRNSYTYTGREWDKEIGLHFFNARYYDPVDGRFISALQIWVWKRER